MAPVSAFAARQGRRQSKGVSAVADLNNQEVLPTSKQVDSDSARRPARKRDHSASNLNGDSKQKSIKTRQSVLEDVPTQETVATGAMSLLRDQEVDPDSRPAAGLGQSELSSPDNETGSMLQEDSQPSLTDKIMTAVDMTISHKQARKLCTTVKPHVLADHGKRGYDIRLQQGETVTFCGLYLLRVTTGTIRIFGATIKASNKTYQVFAPSVHCLPAIEHVQNPFTSAQNAEINIVSTYPEIEALADLHPSFHSLWNELDKESGRSFGFLHNSSQDPQKRPLRAFDPATTWQALSLQLSEPSRVQQRSIMVCGPKGSGKSTFARYLCNSILSIPAVRENGPDSGIFYLDIDPGQPELSPPGDISLVTIRDFLLGPSFSHPIVLGGSGHKRERAHHIGHVSPKDDLKHYIDCVKDLYELYTRSAQRPLIINTCGWIQGPGLDIIEELTTACGVTDIVWMSESGPAEAVEALRQLAPHNGIQLHLIASQSAESTMRSSAELRTMQTMSYFHLDEDIAGTPYWSTRPKAHDQAQTIQYRGLEPDILGVMQLGNRINPQLLGRVIDGTVLSLVEVEDASCLPLSFLKSSLTVSKDASSTLNSDPNSRVSTSHEDIPYLFLGEGTCSPLPPAKTRTLGQILIHSIDYARGIFQVYTPLKLDSVFDVAKAKNTPLVLVRGHLDTPDWSYTEEYYAARLHGSTARDELNVSGIPESYNSGEHKQIEDGFVGEAFVEDEMTVEGWAKNKRWLQLDKRRDDRKSGDKGQKVWRVRRNLVVNDGTRQTKR